ncbi:MAG: NADH-quinone oxidoreductase subunit I [Armatimonadetes bacterium]|nr:NADH-quinone oxidoreductase subunit I [Armatimonadota bacterium]
MKRRRLHSEIIYTIVSLLKGLGVTFTNLWRKKVTLMYPEERWDLPENYRGMPAMPIDRKTGKDKCIACGACMRICPEQIITVGHVVGEDKKRKLTGFVIDMSRCMFCGLCAEICPTAGIVMSDTYEISKTSREQLVFDLDDLHEIGGFHPDEPEEEAGEQTASEGSGTRVSRNNEETTSAGFGTGVSRNNESAGGGEEKPAEGGTA